jgi:indolepyruvate ferredoxin oxidoreductase alpha subunit
MGASISNATGFNRAGEERVVAVIGDSTFLHSGLAGLVSAVYNRVPTTVVLVDNGTTGMTGHQEHPGTGHTLKGGPAPAVDYEAVIRAIGVEHLTVVDPWDLAATEQAIRAGLDYAGPAVIIARRHCRLLPVEKAEARVPYRVALEDCVLCEECMAAGCPALVWEDDGPHIHAWECTGCSLCAQLCPTEAIVATEVA